MSKAPIRVEIVAPVHNRKAITLLCLRSLSRINSEGIDVHIVIVDDGSTDGTGEAIRREFPEVEIVDGNGELWFTEGTNRGVLTALKHDPQFILTINDDAVFDSEFLQYMVATAQKYTRSIVGSLLLLWDTPHKLFQTSPVWDTWGGGWRHWSSQTVWTVPAKPWEVGIIVGNCVLIPAAAFRECGLMDSKRYPNFGDAEHTPRLKRLGWQLVIDPRARVFCQPNTPPTRLRSMGIKKMISALVVDMGNGHNLRRRFFAYVDGAPSKFQGILAYIMFLARSVVGKTNERAERGQIQPEEPLNITFASSVVDD